MYITYEYLKLLPILRQRQWKESVSNTLAKMYLTEYRLPWLTKSSSLSQIVFCWWNKGFSNKNNYWDIWENMRVRWQKLLDIINDFYLLKYCIILQLLSSVQNITFGNRTHCKYKMLLSVLSINIRSYKISVFSTL